MNDFHFYYYFQFYYYNTKLLFITMTNNKKIIKYHKTQLEKNVFKNVISHTLHTYNM